MDRKEQIKNLDRIAAVLVDVVEIQAKKATTVAEVEALAAVTLALLEVLRS